MDEAQIHRLQQSFKLIVPRGPEMVDHFFAHLFSKHPVLRPLFPRDMSSQKREFLASFMLVMQNLGKTEKLQQVLIDLVRRHPVQPAQIEYYPIVRDTLIGVMKDMAGSQWSAQLTQDWLSALNIASCVLIKGRDQSQKAPAMKSVL